MQMFFVKKYDMEEKNLSGSNIGLRIQQLVDHYADGKNIVFAAKLDINEANIRSYYRGTLPKADVLEKIVLFYDVNAYWLLTGKGCMDDANEGGMVLKSTDHSEIVDKLLNKLDERAQEIGALKERVRQLEDDLNDDTSLNGSDVDDAQTFTANVG
jgi:hypothetical protein